VSQSWNPYMVCSTKIPYKDINKVSNHLFSPSYETCILANPNSTKKEKRKKKKEKKLE
jgi:hypothetical protein